jgi:hypothetical protein
MGGRRQRVGHLLAPGLPARQARFLPQIGPEAFLKLTLDRFYSSMTAYAL